MPTKPYQQSDIKYHQRFDKDLQCWCDVLDSDGNKVKSNICLCNATSSDTCRCGAFSEYWDNLFELYEVY